MNSVLFGVSYIGKAKNLFHREFANPEPRRSATPNRESTRSREAFTSAMMHARKWGERHRRGAFGIVVASSGRSDSMIESMATDFCQVPFGDLAAVDAAVDSRTVAIVLEVPSSDPCAAPAFSDYVEGVEKLCRELNILLIRNDA